MEKTFWKTTAIVFLVLFVLESSMIIWGIFLIEQEQDDLNECYYNFCSEFPQAILSEGVCRCYSFDDYGDYVLEKTKIVK